MAIDKSILDHYITPWQAVRQLGMGMPEIEDLVREGKLKAAVMTDGTLGISQQSLQALLPKEALPEYREHVDLQDVPISINEAGRKYGLNTSTLTRWMQRGLIQQLRKEGRKTLLNEADVAYCARIYKQNSGQGKWAFNRDGKPHK
jgi:predicted site-specific integrase-resolvase